MSRRARFALGGGVIVTALGYMMYAGVTQSVVYFVTPTELQATPVTSKAYRLGGLVAPGSLRWEPRSRDLSFTLTDERATVLVRHRGSAPDLLAEGRGAIVEGTWVPEGYFRATQILAKHSEDYRVPEMGGQK